MVAVPVGVMVSGVVAIFFPSSVTGMVCEGTVELVGVTAGVVVVVSEVSAGLPWPQAIQISADSETAIIDRHFIFQK